jgi:TRAP-type uncharacterized transport system fused permease subunit
MVAEWSNGILVIACFITMLVSLLFGMGVPTMVAYALVAIMAAPALMNMGVPMLEAHFFVMFFAVYSNLTPPVAMAALAGSGIAGSPYFTTAFISFRISLISFILPFLIIWNPTLILQPPNLTIGVLTVVSVLLGMFLIEASAARYYIVRLSLIDEILVIPCAILFFGYAFTTNVGFFVVAIFMMILVTLRQLRLKKHGVLKLSDDSLSLRGRSEGESARMDVPFN